MHWLTHIQCDLNCAFNICFICMKWLSLFRYNCCPWFKIECSRSKDLKLGANSLIACLCSHWNECCVFGVLIVLNVLNWFVNAITPQLTSTQNCIIIFVIFDFHLVLIVSKWWRKKETLSCTKFHYAFYILHHGRLLPLAMY